MSQADDNEDDDYESGDEGDTARRAHEKPMGFFEHLEELRWVLLKCVVVYGVFVAILAVFLKRFHHLLLWPLEIARASHPQLSLDLGTTGVTESFSVALNICALGALLPSVPFFFFFAAQFVAPALTAKEKRMVAPVCVASLLLFAAGSALSFLVLAPGMLKFSAQFNEMLGFVTRWTPGSYYATITWLTIGAGLSFQAPLVLLLLVQLGFLRTRTLRKYRRHAIVAIVILVALVSPTPDPLMMAAFAAPLYLLFELSIILGRRVEKKRALRDGEEDEDEDEDDEEEVED